MRGGWRSIVLLRVYILEKGEGRGRKGRLKWVGGVGSIVILLGGEARRGESFIVLVLFEFDRNHCDCCGSAAYDYGLLI